jgi:hypothetical protein
LAHLKKKHDGGAKHWKNTLIPFYRRYYKGRVDVFCAALGKRELKAAYSRAYFMINRFTCGIERICIG